MTKAEGLAVVCHLQLLEEGLQKTRRIHEPCCTLLPKPQDACSLVSSTAHPVVIANNGKIWLLALTEFGTRDE
jgi:hypothetical protein